ncbi:MAG: AAA family ATPase [Verrucomicrobiota bacterium]
MSFESASDFEQVVGLLIGKAGWTVTMPPKNQRGYDLVAQKDGRFAAVQIKNYRSPVKVPQVEKFMDFMDSPEAGNFTEGWMICSSQFSPQALVYYHQRAQIKVRLGHIGNGQTFWEPVPGEEIYSDEEDVSDEVTYIGVFTAKGGVGKTTVSAHLAGAMAMSGYEVALIDLDPQGNLSVLLGEGVTVKGKGRKTHAVTIYNRREWKRGIDEDVKAVICDCSPVFKLNPKELIAKLDYCIVPTTLNPLGLNKNGYVIKETLQEIRSVNPDAFVFVLVNNYYGEENKKCEVLKQHYKSYFNDLSLDDPRFLFIDPDDASIRNSKQLYYWGYHLYTDGKPALAFTPVGGRCYPKADFLNLLDHLEENSRIENLK